MIVRTTLLLLAIMLGGCAFHQAPYVMYDGDVPLANTAVFSSFDDKATTRISLGLEQTRCRANF